ncbi:glycosyltransferase family 4 protein [Pseudoalteromonas nigrifaciens]|uniref:glycosyltransferase family 4 protein n=1 Tax=Pseudoalteromonas nigrifaciens TaxID=28109 RepID=UPI0017883076|nr:glycosyltransferase family 4 protein [Pseudoalteromonas nigrifaciens]MBE0421551.1 glycosyltransferase family 4 protein [Pseudoalteromonas nigrifaciens]
MSAYKSIKQLSLLLSENKIDVYFGYFLKPVLFGGLAAWLAKVPKRIGMIEGLGQLFTDSENGSSLKQLLLRKIFSIQFKFIATKLDYLIVLNKDDKDTLSKFSPSANIQVLGGIGVDLEEFPYVPLEPREITRFIFIGRLLKEKGINYFLEAAELIKKDFSNAEFHILGTVDLTAKNTINTALLAKLIKNDVVLHKGYVNNVSEYLASSSVFVLPSYYREGVPRSTQEAMATGRAVITTDSVGCKDTVVNGYNGYLVEKFNSIDLAEKMKLFLTNLDRAALMGINGRKLAEDRFDASNINKRLMGYIYD